MNSRFWFSLTWIIFIFCSTALGQQKSKSEVISSNSDIYRYDSLYQIYAEIYVPNAQLIAKEPHNNFNIATDELDIPESIFVPLAKSYLTTNLFHRGLDGTKDMDMYGKLGHGWVVKKQIARRLPEPWPTFSRIHGYILVEITSDIHPRNRGFHIAQCKIVDDLFNNVDEENIYLSHNGDWSELVSSENDKKTYLLEISRGGKMRNEQEDRITIYYSSGRRGSPNNYILIEDGKIHDDNKVLFDSFESYADLKTFIHNFISDIRN